MLQSSEVERPRRELRELRATCAAGRRRLNATEEKLLESSLDSVEGLSAQLAKLIKARGGDRHLTATVRRRRQLAEAPGA